MPSFSTISGELLLKHGDSLKPPGRTRISVAVQYFSGASDLGFGAVVVAAVTVVVAAGAVVVAAGAVVVAAGALVVADGAGVVEKGGDTAAGDLLLLDGVTAGDGSIGCEYDERKGKAVTNTASKIGIPASLRLLPSNAHLRILWGRFI